jgi:acetolactate synthase-1/2/3 large subunit
MRGADLVVECLRRQGVTHVFGIPGAKIDAVFDALRAADDIELVVCRHEQNAAFIAGGIGRMTGRPGVALETSGPGVTNLVTGLATATSEGDPVIAIGGNAPNRMRLHATHQNLDNVALLGAATRYSNEVIDARTIPEVIANAFRSALTTPQGAAFVSLPSDVCAAEVDAEAGGWVAPIALGHAPDSLIAEVAREIEAASMPVLLLGMRASAPAVAAAINGLLAHRKVPVVGTFQAAGAVSLDNVDCFVGRVGLFRNQPGDALLADSDLVIAVGFDPIEYDPEVWNADRAKRIFSIDGAAATLGYSYSPELELVGDIDATLDALAARLCHSGEIAYSDVVTGMRADLTAEIERGASLDAFPVHPLRIVHDVRQAADARTTICCDVGSFYMWVARNYIIHEPRRLLFSNGQQTLGVALPWAIAANIVRPGEPVISMSGDGGFLFSAMELETAHRLGCRFVHIIWNSAGYDMVAEQEVMKCGAESGTELGEIDIPSFAKAFGARGIRLGAADELLPAIREGLAHDGITIIDVPVDCSENPKLFDIVHWRGLH